MRSHERIFLISCSRYLSSFLFLSDDSSIHNFLIRDLRSCKWIYREDNLHFFRGLSHLLRYNLLSKRKFFFYKLLSILWLESDFHLDFDIHGFTQAVRLLSGSVSGRRLQTPHCPVLEFVATSPPPHSPAYTENVAPLDFKSCSHESLCTKHHIRQQYVPLTRHRNAPHHIICILSRRGWYFASLFLQL